MPGQPKKSLFALLSLVFCAFLLAACSQVEAMYSTYLVTSPPTGTPQPTATPLPPTATVKVCRDTRGKITEFTLPSKILPAPINVKVYTPPCYDDSAQYPVLYMLHGSTFLNDQWVRIGLTDTADELIISKQISPMIIVLPQEDASLSDPTTAKFGDALIEELLPWVDQKYATCSDRECRAIGGLSRGGNWAVRLGLSNWQSFVAIGAHSTPLFISDLGRIAYWIRGIPSSEQIPYIYIDMGRSDENSENILQFNDELNRLHVAHEFYQFDGYHDENYWSQHVEEYLRWYAGIFNSCR
jgi:enterochelin esterase-like enzyme